MSDPALRCSGLRIVFVLLGLCLSGAAFPQTYMAAQAMRELGHPTPGAMTFVDFETYHWARHAFVLAHFWLGWALRDLAVGPPLRATRAAVALVALEVGIFWVAVVWLALRGWGLFLL